MIRRRCIGILLLILMLCMPGVCAAGGTLTVTLPDGVSGGKVALAKTTLAWDTDLEDETILEEAEALGYHSDQEVSVTDGTARFDDLEPGIYYVLQTEPCTGYDNFRGFLTRIDSSNASVEAVPKMHSRTISPVTPVKPTENKVQSTSGNQQGISSKTTSVVSVATTSENAPTGLEDNRLIWLGGTALIMLIAMALFRSVHRGHLREHL